MSRAQSKRLAEFCKLFYNDYRLKPVVA